VVQEKTSNWLLGDHISSSAELLLSYRLLDPRNIQKKADVILHGSKNSDLHCDDIMEMSAYLQDEAERGRGRK
jgi:cell division GTPase FtsZ